MVKPPILVVEKDDGSISLYDSPMDARIAQDIEAIDLKNDEYVFYDSEGRLLQYRIATGKRPFFLGLFQIHIEHLEFERAETEPKHREELRVALVRFLRDRGMTEDSLRGDSLDVLIKKTRSI